MKGLLRDLRLPLALILIGLAAAWLTGCESVQTYKTIHYDHCPSSWTLIVDSSQAIQVHCGEGNADDGSGKIAPLCCVRGNTVYADVNAPSCVSHEIGHICGHRQPEKDGMNWPGTDNYAASRWSAAEERQGRIK